MPLANCSVAAATRSVISSPFQKRYEFVPCGFAWGFVGALAAEIAPLTLGRAIFVVLTSAIMLSVSKNGRFHRWIER